MKQPPKELVEQLEESFRWSRDHKGEKHRHVIPCEWCYQQGMMFAMSLFTGEHVPDIRREFSERINNERAKSKVVRRRSEAATTPKRKVVRRKK